MDRGWNSRNNMNLSFCSWEKAGQSLLGRVAGFPDIREATCKLQWDILPKDTVN